MSSLVDSISMSSSRQFTIKIPESPDRTCFVGLRILIFHCLWLPTVALNVSGLSASIMSSSLGIKRIDTGSLDGEMLIVRSITSNSFSSAFFLPSLTAKVRTVVGSGTKEY
jgi:hypothetical protein